MGKKRKIISKTQKYGKKYAKHPASRAQEIEAEETKLEPIVEAPKEKAAKVESKGPQKRNQHRPSPKRTAKATSKK